MRAIVIAALALATIITATTAASARGRHHYRAAHAHRAYAAEPCGSDTARWCQRPARVTRDYSARRRGYRQRASHGCRAYLGCGCRLARYLGIPNPHHVLDRARNWLTKVGSRASHGCINCVMVLSRGRHGGHVAQVRGYDAHGNPVGYSWGNPRVGWFTKTYSRRRVLGYRSI